MSAQRLGDYDHVLGVVANPPTGLTVSGPRWLKLDGRTGGGTAKLSVVAGPGTAEGYHEVPVTVRVTPRSSLTAACGNVGVSDDGDTGAANLTPPETAIRGRRWRPRDSSAAGRRRFLIRRSSGLPRPPDNVVPAGQVIDLRGSATTRLLFVGAAANGDHRATATFTDCTTATREMAGRRSTRRHRSKCPRANPSPRSRCRTTRTSTSSRSDWADRPGHGVRRLVTLGRSFPSFGGL